MAELMIYLAQIVALCRKEAIAVFKDPANRTILLAPVLIQSVLFGYGATYDLIYVPYAVVDQSRSEASTRFLARLDGTGVFERAATLASNAQIAEMIDSGEILLAISIPADFERRLSTGAAAPLQIILDGRNSATAGAAAAQISTIVADYNRSMGRNPPVRIEQRAWYNPNLESRWTLMLSLIAALSLMQTLLLSALSVAREREHGTFDQLLVTPLAPMQILVGKAVPAILIGVLQSTIIVLIIRFWFQIPMHGSYALLYLGLFSFTIAGVGVGLSISAFSLTMREALLYSFMIIMPMVLLSGMLTPVRNMPEILQAATYANPLRFGTDMVRRIYLEGAVFEDIAFDFVPLLVMSAVTLPLAAWLFRHRLA